MPRVGEEKVWVEAEQAGNGDVVLSLADVRRRRALMQQYGKHNVFTSPHRLNNFPTQFMADLQKGRPVRFKMYESVYEKMLNGGAGGSGLSASFPPDIWDESAEEPHVEPWWCEICEGEVERMGILGSRMHGRCRACGMDQSYDVEEGEGLGSYEKSPERVLRAPMEVQRLYEAMVQSANKAGHDGRYVVYVGESRDGQRWSIGDNRDLTYLWFYYTPEGWKYKDEANDIDEPIPASYRKVLSIARVFWQKHAGESMWD